MSKINNKYQITPVSGEIYEVFYRPFGSCSKFVASEVIVASSVSHAFSLFHSYIKEVEVLGLKSLGECMLDRDSPYNLPF